MCLFNQSCVVGAGWVGTFACARVAKVTTGVEVHGATPSFVNVGNDEFHCANCCSLVEGVDVVVVFVCQLATLVQTVVACVVGGDLANESVNLFVFVKNGAVYQPACVGIHTRVGSFVVVEQRCSANSILFADATGKFCKVVCHAHAVGCRAVSNGRAKPVDNFVFQWAVFTWGNVVQKELGVVWLKRRKVLLNVVQNVGNFRCWWFRWILWLACAKQQTTCQNAHKK